MIGRFFSRLGVGFMQAISHLPLAWLRALGAALGVLLFALVRGRRHVALVNLRLCFPGKSEQERVRIARRHFIHFAQAWLDRSWLWHAPPDVVRCRLLITGALRELGGNEPAVLFAPHFVGMDAGWTAITQQIPRRFVGIYTRQSNPVVDRWMLQGRHRFPAGRPFGRADGVRGLVSALKDGELLYLLPDMNFGPSESVFVPFYGVPAATVPSLSRFSRMGGAKVVPVVTRMTPAGYEVQVMEAWPGFPTKDAVADTAQMNLRLQSYIDAMPAQYYWVHKRFKSRPDGLPGVY